MTETSTLILQFRQRLLRAYEDIKAAQADAKEIELEARVRGLNAPELKAWVKAELGGKAEKLVASTVDRVLYGESLGYDLGMVPRSGPIENSRDKNGSKEEAAFDPETGEIHEDEPETTSTPSSAPIRDDRDRELAETVAGMQALRGTAL